MKIKTTRKELLRHYGKINAISIGYCDAWHLLHGARLEPFAYCAGVYGWNFDAYDVDGVLLCTGYRGMLGQDAKNLQKYEDKARALVEGYRFDADNYKRKRAALQRKCRKLLDSFINETLKK